MLERRSPSLINTDLELIKASQYMSAVGLVILLWDHILTFPDEVQLIWKPKLSTSKLLFLSNRYMVPLAMLVQAYEFSGATHYLSLTLCKIWSANALAAGMLSIATSNFLVLLRLWVLWDRSPRLMLGTLTFFILTQLSGIGLTMLYLRHFQHCTSTPFPVSAFLKPNPTMYCYGVPIAFEFMIFLTSVWNAFDRPRSWNSQMAKILYQDGSMYFFGLFALRLVSMVVSVVAPVSLVFMGVFFAWSVSNITLAHLILNLRRLSRDAGGEAENGAEEGVTCTDTELLTLQGPCSNQFKIIL